MVSIWGVIIPVILTFGLVAGVIIAALVFINSKQKELPRAIEGEGRVGGDKPFGLLDPESILGDEAGTYDSGEGDDDDEPAGARTLGEPVKGASKRKPSWKSETFEELFGGDDEIPRRAPFPTRTSPLEAKITAAWFDDDEKTPMSFTGECLLELTLDGKHHLYLGTGYVSVHQSDDDDEEDEQTTPFYTGYGEIGCVDEPAGRAWLRAFCDAVSSEVPTYRNVKRKDELEVSVHYFGIEEDGEEWHLLGYQATWVSSEMIYVRLSRGGDRAELFLSTAPHRYPECIYGWGELVLRLENEERPSPSNDPQIIREQPLVSESSPFEWHHEERKAIYQAAGECLIAFDYGESYEGPSALKVLRWRNMLEPELELELVTGYVYVATCSRDGKFALVVAREQVEGASVLYVFDLDGGDEHSFLLPSEWYDESTVLFSPTGGEIALSMQDSYGRGWVRICDRVGNVIEESPRIDGFILLEEWSSRGLIGGCIVGHEDEDAYYQARVDSREFMRIWDRERQGLDWERLDLVGRPSPDGVYDFRPGPFDYRFFKEGELISTRPARTGWDLQHVLDGNGEQMTWLHGTLVVLDHEPWEILDVETGQVLSLVTEEIQNEHYSVLFLDSDIVFFEGTESCHWAKLTIPSEFLGGDDKTANASLAW